MRSSASSCGCPCSAAAAVGCITIAARPARASEAAGGCISMPVPPARGSKAVAVCWETVGEGLGCGVLRGECDCCALFRRRAALAALSSTMLVPAATSTAQHIHTLAAFKP